MTSHEELLARQAAWQKSRQTLSWPEKIRQAARMRSSIEALRKERQKHQRREPSFPRKTG
jgi:hypothetical protein